MDTLSVAVKSVATTAALAGVGIYLHRREILSPTDKTVLSRFAQQVALPALFFVRIVSNLGGACEDDDLNCDEESSRLKQHLKNGWLVCIWPLVVVSCGLLVGWLVAVVTRTTTLEARRSVLVSCAFANSTILPITLLGVIQSQMDPEAIDADVFLSFYLLLYPMLQWSLGNWLIVSASSQDNDEPAETQAEKAASIPTLVASKMDSSRTFFDDIETASEISLTSDDTTSSGSTDQGSNEIVPEEASQPAVWYTVLCKIGQPPVLGSLVGIVVAAIGPFRNVLLGDDAVLNCFFVALEVVGQATVPATMTVLGVSLSVAAQRYFKRVNLEEESATSQSTVSPATIIGVVIGKMVLMPLIGIGLAYLIKLWQLVDLPPDANESFYVALTIVFITPTANNVIVMADLAGGNVEGIVAKFVACQYVVAPLILTLSVSCVLQLAAM